MFQASLHFKVDQKQVRIWVAKKPSIRAWSYNSSMIRATNIKKRCERCMAAKFPHMEKHLHI